jgi:chromosome segregation ATPase
MNYKELIKTQLFLLKSMGKSRREIEKDLGYAVNYIDQALSRGGNENLYHALVIHKEKLEAKANVLNDDGAGEYNSEKDLIDLQKEIINDLRGEKLKWSEEKNKLDNKIESLEANLLSLQSRNEFLEAKLLEMSKQTRSA